MRRLFPYKKVIIATLLVAASVFLMNVTGSSVGSPSLWERMLWQAVQPPLSLLTSAKQSLSSFTSAFQAKEDLIEENRELKHKLESAEALLARYRGLHEENRSLRELLELKEELAGEFRASAVIGRDPTRWFSAVTIGLGEEDGLKVDAPVVSRRGLVGRIIKVYGKQAKVLLLTDSESGVGALTARSRDYGVVLGGNGQDSLTMQFFSKNADVRAGDLIMTSGVGSLYPEGFLIGEVIDVYVPQPGLVKECRVRPATDFEHLEEVLVMMSND